MKAVTFVRLLTIPLVASALVLLTAVNVDAEPGRAGGPETRSKQTRKTEPVSVIEPGGALTLLVSFGLVGALVARGWRRPRA